MQVLKTQLQVFGPSPGKELGSPSLDLQDASSPTRLPSPIPGTGPLYFLLAPTAGTVASGKQSFPGLMGGGR